MESQLQPESFEANTMWSLARSPDRKLVRTGRETETALGVTVSSSQKTARLL